MMASGHDWALVADGRRARIFQRRAPAGAWAELESEAVALPDPPAQDGGTDRPGRGQENAGDEPLAIQPQSDPQEAAEPGFARALAARLATAAGEGRFGRVALVAPPGFLGALRAALAPAQAVAVLGTLDQDLTQHAPEAIAARLQALHAP